MALDIDKILNANAAKRVDCSAAKYFIRLARSIDNEFNRFVFKCLFVDNKGFPVTWDYDPSERLGIADAKPAVMFGFSQGGNSIPFFLRKSNMKYGNAFYFLYDFKNSPTVYKYNEILFDSTEMYEHAGMFDSILVQLLLQVSNGYNIFLNSKKIINAHEEALVQVEIDLIDTI